MEDLSHLAADSVTVTSQEAGNLVHDASGAMTAPGTEPVTPMPPVEDQPDPQLGTSSRIPVGTPASRHVHGGYAPSPVRWTSHD